MSHTPPEGADNRIDEAALDYLQHVQCELGTTHKMSVATVAIIGIFRACDNFGVSRQLVNDAVQKLFNRLR